MNTRKITYKSQQLYVSTPNQSSTLTLSSGFFCVFNGMSRASSIEISWKFNWKQLEESDVDGLSGQIIVKSTHNSFQPTKVNIDLKETVQLVSTVIPTSMNGDQLVSFDLFFLPYYHKTKQMSYEEHFSLSEKTDTILVVDGKKLHVNKAFLSFHSDYFHVLCSSNFKNEQINEISIDDVSYEDFGLFLSIFHPNPVFPNDETVEKLLELADRFQTSAVTAIVEHHLLHNSRIGDEKKMSMADKYGMPELLQTVIRKMNSIEKARALKAFPGSANFSISTKAHCVSKSDRDSSPKDYSNRITKLKRYTYIWIHLV
uniref:BTB domain-containing protein n=2 Tax=Caenorhabditis tropicalis TaxID=1561998 RepID=A0A1I7UHU6_9PELO